MEAVKISKKESNKRLNLLARFLTNLPPVKFDFGQWVGEDWQGNQDLSCGTKACALGWAATLPEFRAAGLRLISVPDSWGDGKVSLVINVEDAKSFGILTRHPDEVSIRAAMTVFGLTNAQATRLFTPQPTLTSNATPQEVAKHIRKFVKSRS